VSLPSKNAPTVSDPASRRCLNTLSTLPADRFDRYDRLIRHLFNLPSAQVSFYMNDGREPSPAAALCDGAMGDQTLLVVEDARNDIRFATEPGMRFCAAMALQDSNGQRYGLLCITDVEPRPFSLDDQTALQDVANMAMDEISARQLAVTDELTGLSNRRGYELLADKALALCRRMEQPAVIVMLDLVGLAEINDLHGFAAGDRILRNFADLLAARVRESDVIARIGGDEFAMVLIGTDALGADTVLARLHENLEQMNQASTSAGRVEFRAGCTLYDSDTHATVFDALRDADEQMYRAKNSAC
jgi:diguanylate cyclase (GGDEF)-like protein